MARVKIIEMPHPYLAGVMCRSDGTIRTPAGNITAGHKTPGGYRVWQMQHPKKNLLIHRLMAEAFLQCPIPEGMQIDHISRDKSDNSLGNIRITTPSENMRNTAKSEEAFKRLGYHPADNPLEYAREYAREHAADACRRKRARYANDPEYRAKELARRKAYQESHREERRAYHRNRWDNDLEFREKQKARNIEARVPALKK